MFSKQKWGITLFSTRTQGSGIEVDLKKLINRGLRVYNTEHKSHW